MFFRPSRLEGDRGSEDNPLTCRRVSLLTVAAVICILVSPQLVSAQMSLTGGYTSILGHYASGGWGFRLSPATTFTLGSTFSETFGLEPLVGLTTVQQLNRGWNATATVSRGGLGGDYRVERLPDRKSVV